MPELVIDESNYVDYIGDGKKIVWDGEKRLFGALPRVTQFGCYNNIPSAKPEFLVPRSEWDRIIEEKDRDKSWLSDLIKSEERDFISEKQDQNSLGYCWNYCVTICGTINRLKQGLSLVALASESVGGPIVNFRNEGGWPENALHRYMSHGACLQDYLDRPNSLSPRRWKSGWEENALNHRITEWMDLDFNGKQFDSIVSAAFWGIPCAVVFNWWGHAVTSSLRVRKVNGRYQVMFWNSWGKSYGDNGWFWMQEGKGTPDGGTFGVTQMITV